MSETATRNSGQRRRYPSLNLEQAIERVRVLYNQERRNPAPVDVVVQHWGFKSIKTGPASTAYSAVKQFGLLDESGSGAQRTASVSSRAWAILTAPEDVAAVEIRAAALEPPMNRTIWNRFGVETGSPQAFSWLLVSEMGFSDTGAREFAKQYFATIRFAGLDEGDQGEGTDVDTDHAEGLEPEEDLSPQTLTAGPDPQARPQSGVATAPPESKRGHYEASATGAVHPFDQRSRHAIPLIGGKQVILEGEFPLTEEAWQGFMAVLQAFKPGLVESHVDGTPRTIAEEKL